MRAAALELAHREIFEDALLRLAESVVPHVERLLHLPQLDLLRSRFLVPRKRDDPVEIRADHLILAGGRREHAHALRLATRLLHHLLGETRFLDLLEQIDGFLLPRIGFAELRLDRAQLLAQIELALVLLDLHLGLALDVLHHAGALHFALEAREHEADALADVEALNHLVLVRYAEVHVGCREVGEPPRVRHVHLEDRRHLIRDAVHQLRQRLGRVHQARHQLLTVHRIERRLRGRANARDGVRLALLDALDDDPAQPLQRDLHGVAREIDPLVHSCGHADAAEEGRGIDCLIVIAAGDDQADDQPGFVVGTDDREIFRGAHLDRDGAERVDDRRPQRHEREGRRQLGLEDLFLALCSGHGRQVGARGWGSRARIALNTNHAYV